MADTSLSAREHRRLADVLRTAPPGAEPLAAYPEITEADARSIRAAMAGGEPVVGLAGVFDGRAVSLAHLTAGMLVAPRPGHGLVAVPAVHGSPADPRAGMAYLDPAVSWDGILGAGAALRHAVLGDGPAEPAGLEQLLRAAAREELTPATEMVIVCALLSPHSPHL